MSVDIGCQSDEEVDGPPAGTVFLFPSPDVATTHVDVTVTVSAGRWPAPRVLNESASKTVPVADLEAGTVTLKFI